MASKRKARGRANSIPLAGLGAGAESSGSGGSSHGGGAAFAENAAQGAADLLVARRPTTAELIKGTDADFIRRHWEHQYAQPASSKLLDPPPPVEDIAFANVKTSVLKSHGVRFTVRNEKNGSTGHYFLCLANDGECLGRTPIIRIQESSTARATRHLKDVHDVVPSKTRASMAKRAVVDARSEIVLDCYKEDPKRTLQHLVAVLANRGTWSYNTFKLPEWRVFCRIFGVERELATQMDIVQIMTEQYAFIRNSIRERIAAARAQAQGLPFLSINLDLSSNAVQRRRSVSVRVSFIGKDQTLESYNLAIRAYKPPKQVSKHARVLFQYIDGLLKHFGASSEMVLTAVANGGPDLLQNLFAKEMAGVRFEWCLAHVLNLAMRDAIGEARELLNRMAETINFVRKPAHENLLNEIQREIFKSEPVKLLRVTEQHWLALEPVMRRFVDLSPAIEELCKRLKDKSPMRAREIDAVHELLSVMRPFHNVHEMSQAEGLVSLDTIAYLQSAIIALKNKNHVKMVARATRRRADWASPLAGADAGLAVDAPEERAFSQLTEVASRAAMKLLAQLDASYFDRFHAVRAVQDLDRDKVLRFAHEHRQTNNFYPIKAPELKFSYIFEMLFFLHPKTKTSELMEAIIMRHFGNISTTELGDLVAPLDAASHHVRMLYRYILGTMVDLCTRVAEMNAAGAPHLHPHQVLDPDLSDEHHHDRHTLEAHESGVFGTFGASDAAWDASATASPDADPLSARAAKRAKPNVGTDYLDVLFAAVGRSNSDAPAPPDVAPTESPRVQAEREIGRYTALEVTEEARSLQGAALISWWANQRRHFPLLSTVALCMLGTSPSCLASDIPRPNRSRLSTANVDLSTVVALNKHILPAEMHEIPPLERKQAARLRLQLEQTFNFPDLDGDASDDEGMGPHANLDLGDL